MNPRERNVIRQAYRTSTLDNNQSHQQAMSVLVQAAQQAIHGGPRAVQSFMAAQGFPQDGAWCGEFAAAVVRSTGGTPPRNPQVASNWRNFGTPTATPHPGDVAIRIGQSSVNPANRVGTGQTGSHVTFVGGVDPRTGTFTGIGGNQGSNRHQPTAPGRYPVSGFEFRTPTVSSVVQNPFAEQAPITRSIGEVAQSAQPSSSLPPAATGSGSNPTGGYGDVPAGYAYNANGQLVPYSPPTATPAPTAAPYTVPYENIPFSVPPSMPDNIVPQENIPFSVPPSMPDNIPPYQPQTYSPERGLPIGTDSNFGGSQGYGQGSGFSIPITYGSGLPSQYFNSVTNTYQNSPQSSQQQYVGNFDLTGGAQSQPSLSPVAMMNLGGFSQAGQTNFYTDPNSGMQYVFGQDGNMYPAFSGYQIQPNMALNVDTSLEGPNANVASNDIQNFGGDMSLGGDLPSATDAYFGVPTAAEDSFAGAQAQGSAPIDAFAGSQTDAGASYQAETPLSDPMLDSLAQGSAATVQGTFVGDNGMYMRFDPQTGTYQPTGVMAPTTNYNSSNPNYYSSSNLGSAALGNYFGAGSTGGYQGGSTGYGGFTQTAGPMFSSLSSVNDTSQQVVNSRGADLESISGPEGGTVMGRAPAVRDEGGAIGEGDIMEARAAKQLEKRGYDPIAYNDQLDATTMAAAANQPQQYITGWNWQKNPLSTGGHSVSGGGIGPMWSAWSPNWQSKGGWWSPIYGPTAPTTPVPMPTSGGGGRPAPTTPHLAGGGAINIAQWMMNRKSGKVPGVDHGVDEVAAMLEPGELVINKKQLQGLKIGDKSKLRSDQIKAIKGAQKKKAA